ncbi:bpX5 domain-containing protein [Solirubrobacter deserti]|uniref:MoxR-vWA-beta-propeller ternary system domain-containing protein n=1 Tax=Solirubrobacter deserti TaxID=2282478 RepID=A0ABT4RCD7_9ACTN|nr:hypothetical protein [Solirubrobacter deserti]MDA0136192.1 hypothetical protein [Solirubrobacter deserti]
MVATGPALRGLTGAARRALEAGVRLRAAQGDGWLVVLGGYNDLPWADGCVYVGADGPLLLPTTRALDIEGVGGGAAVELVAGALGDGLIVVLDEVVLRGPRPMNTAAL